MTTPLCRPWAGMARKWAPFMFNLGRKCTLARHRGVGGAGTRAVETSARHAGEWRLRGHQTEFRGFQMMDRHLRPASARCLGDRGTRTSGIRDQDLIWGRQTAHNVILKLYNFVSVAKGKPGPDGDRWIVLKLYTMALRNSLGLGEELPHMRVEDQGHEACAGWLGFCLHLYLS